MIDPSLYKNNLQKFSDNTIDVKPKPLDQLTYFHNDYIKLSADEKKSIKMTNNFFRYIRSKKYQNISYVKNERNAEGQNGNIPSPDKLPQSNVGSLKKLKNKVASKQEQLNKVRLEAIKQRALEKKAGKDKITQALRKYDGSTKSKNHIIFSDNDLAKSILGYESGRERLNHQKNFRCDDRFKLTSDFVSDDENNDTDENNIMQN
ncbi:hypothetical protein C2G38_2077919, partial [Gigaspora rosea]